MIKNGKFFQSPPKSGKTFKELFIHATTTGVGRPANKDGYPIGPWTPELLADAISQIDANRKGVDLRTVQLWFENNKRGIGPTNIRWLAMVFGCRDPEGTSEWQVELSASQSRLKARRKQKEKAGGLGEQPALDVNQAAEPQNVPHAPKLDQAAAPKAPDAENVPPKQRFNLARASEALFNGRSSLNLPVAIWTTGGVLWFLAFIFGVHSVTYNPVEGLDKEVGFYWSISWTVGEMAVLPLFLILVSELLTFWKEERLPSLAVTKTSIEANNSWEQKVGSFSFSYWAIFIICFLGIFFIQWYGIYLRPLLESNSENPMVDWILVTISRPEIMSISEAIFVSMFAFLYSGMIYWFYFIGLLLLYTLANDFYRIYINPELQPNEIYQRKMRANGTKIMTGIFRCVVLGILLATCIKVNAAYLISDGETILDWLIGDALTALGVNSDGWSWLEQNPSPFFTSFLLTFITCFVFFACFAQIYWVLDGCFPSKEGQSLKGNSQVQRLVSQVKALWFKMVSVVVLLAVNFMVVGKFYGFSILLFGSVVISAYSLLWRTRAPEEKLKQAHELN
ncbi:hypothetical protein A9D60_17530 [Leisingera sp. JC1]|nr:hypothetical protein A9D60_17530 [Leisingera sp. JC1]